MNIIREMREDKHAMREKEIAEIEAWHNSRIVDELEYRIGWRPETMGDLCHEVDPHQTDDSADALIAAIGRRLEAFGDPASLSEEEMDRYRTLDINRVIIQKERAARRTMKDETDRKRTLPRHEGTDTRHNLVGDDVADRMECYFRNLMERHKMARTTLMVGFAFAIPFMILVAPKLLMAIGMLGGFAAMFVK